MCLTSGQPFVFGFTGYPETESAEVAQTGMLPMPSPGEEALGGHAVACVGYRSSDDHFYHPEFVGLRLGRPGLFLQARFLPA